MKIYKDNVRIVLYKHSIVDKSFKTNTLLLTIYIRICLRVVESDLSFLQ